jgi:uncharacterized protein
MSLPAASSTSTVLITGASSGIGKDLARELAGRGHNVTLVARREPLLRELAAELSDAHGIRADVHVSDLGDADQRADLVAALQAGTLEVVGVANNAGYGSTGPFHTLPLEREAQMVRLNVLALHELTGAFLPAMVRRGSGAILNVASTAAFQPIPSMATYAATKAFVASFSEAIHAELAGTGVSCTSLCPGPTRTEFGERAGVAGLAGKAPGFLFASSDDVARQAVEAMVAGRRSVVPGASNKASMLGGRFVPRGVYLPVAAKVGKRIAERKG